MATKKSTAPPWLKKKSGSADPDERGESAKEEKSETPAQERAEEKDEPGPIQQVKNMVAAHAKVPPEKRDQYRGKVIAHARKCGAMRHVPDSWLKSSNKKG